MNNKFILSPYYLDEEVPGLYSLRETGWLLNRPSLHQGETQDRMATIYEPLAEMVHKIVLTGDRPVSIAGDCCTTIGVMAGLQRAGIDPLLIWFDAHGDFNTWETTPSGFLGGMPLAMLVGRGEQRMPDAVGLLRVPEGNVVLTDGRDLDPGEVVALEESSIRHLTNVNNLLDMDLPDQPIYVHFDTDVVDPQDAPAMNYIAPGGPAAEEVRAIAQHLARNHRVVAASLSSWNPEMDQNGATQATCMRIFNDFISQ